MGGKREADLVSELLDMEGISSAELDVTVRVRVEKHTTGGYDDSFQPIRKRAVDTEDLQELADGTEWQYHGPVDVMNDFYDTDKFSLSDTIAQDDD